jgi:transmembrane sensor
MNTLSSDTTLFDRAMRWVSTLQDGEAASADLFRWLAESPRHVEEFTYALTLHDEIAGIPAEVRAQLASAIAVERAPSVVVPLLSSGARQRSALEPNSGRHKAMNAMAASLAVGVLATAWLVWDGGQQTYRTEIGEQKTFELGDGSVVHLNTQSRLKVRYNDSVREIQLVSGEALFEVRHDPQRPFSVRSDARVVQALGTAFTVYQRPTDLKVAVLEGSVRVSEGKTVIGELKTGEGVRIAPDGRTQPIDAAQAAAWRNRRLIFRNDTLADIAAELNRYNRRPQVRIADQKAGARRFAATFDVNAPEALVHVLQIEPDLAVTYTEEEIVVRSMRE